MLNQQPIADEADEAGDKSGASPMDIFSNRKRLNNQGALKLKKFTSTNMGSSNLSTDVFELNKNSTQDPSTIQEEQSQSIMGTHVDIINEEDAEYMEEELTKLDKDTQPESMLDVPRHTKKVIVNKDND